MDKLFGGIKDKNFLFFAVASSVFFAIAIFLFSALNDKNKTPENPVAPAVPKEKTMDEIIGDLTAPVKEGEKIEPVSEEVIKSLTAPINANSDTATGSKNSKIIQPTPTPVSKDIINSLTAPIKH